MPKLVGENTAQTLTNKTVSGADNTITNAAPAVHTHTKSDITDFPAALKGFVNHGATAGTARPSGYASIEWYGNVEPTNAINGDTWVNTAV